MDEMEIAWLAGLFEGEGCISPQERHGVTRPRLSVLMTDRDVIERIRDVTGCGTISVRPFTEKKTAYVWQCSSVRHSARLLLAMAPLLGNRRRARALDAAEWLRGAMPSPY